jgi:predicted nucleic acid-binding protein
MEARRICLDTTFLIDFLRELPEAVDRIRNLEETGSDISTTSINVFELYLGALRSPSPKRSQQLDAILSDLRILPLGKKEAKEAATTLTELMKRGKPIDMRDALIAGCMLTNAYRSIITRNVEDFLRIRGIDVVKY